MRSILAITAAAGLAISAPASAGQAEAEPAPQAPASSAVNKDLEAKQLAAAKVVQRSLDAWRARNFEGWIAHYSPDVVVAMDAGTIVGRDELRKVYKIVFDLNVPVPQILDSGWVGEDVFVVQREFLPDGSVAGTTYAEYRVSGDKIVAVYGVQTS